MVGGVVLNIYYFMIMFLFPFLEAFLVFQSYVERSYFTKYLFQYNVVQNK